MRETHVHMARSLGFPNFPAFPLARGWCGGVGERTQGT